MLAGLCELLNTFCHSWIQVDAFTLFRRVPIENKNKSFIYDHMKVEVAFKF
jgi:hypothetical protein